MERVCHHHAVSENAPPYRELFVEVRVAPCPWCKASMREIDEDGGTQCEQCGARSLPLAARKAIARR
jgi:hypothetical protein